MITLFAAIALSNSGVDVSRVMVIENTESETSVEIATEYLKARKVKNLLKIQCQDSALDTGKETLPYATFKSVIEPPLRGFLKAHPQIDFIVLTKGIPIRLTGAPTGEGGSQPSLDSFIASLDYAERKDTLKLDVHDSGFTGIAWANRFWNSKERFSHAKFGGYLVTRLDAYTAIEAELLVKYSLQAEKNGATGTILLDTAPSHGLSDLNAVPRSIANATGKRTGTLGELDYKEYDTDMIVAGKLLEKKKVPVVVDLNDKFVGRKGDLMGYCSWGSNDPHFDADGYKLLRFNPGAIAETAVSTSARTFLPTTGGQSLIADLISGRVTGVKGYCDEPLLQAIASPTILFDRYTSGWTLAESYYAASRLTGWEDIVIGDPLCCPYGGMGVKR
jgi:uncharacterized protein (TIGR03790 family)